MILNHLEVENWKCYHKRKSFDFQEHELINARNGTGKSSIFEAVFFAITGKPPVGFNLNTVRYSDKKPCRICLQFEHSGDQMEVERIFGGVATQAVLRVNEMVVVENVKGLDAWFANTINMKVLSILWTTNLVSSDTLSAKFFTEAILEDALQDPNRIIAEYTGKIYRANREVNGYNPGEILDAKQIAADLELLEGRLKSQSAVKESDVAKARLAEKAAQELELLKDAPELVKNVDIPAFKRLHGKIKQLKEALAEEMSKRDSIYSAFSSVELLKILEASEKSGKCVVCGGNFDQSHKKALQDELSLAGRSELKIESLRKDLEVAGSCTPERVQLYEQWQDAQRALNACLNWKETLDEFDQENSKLWEEFNRLQSQRTLAERQAEGLKRIEGLRADILDWKCKMEVVKEWVEEATQSYTEQLMAKAGQYLANINNRYKQIAIYGKEFVVVVENEDFALNMLPVSRLSNGEKTMVALSLLFAIHNIFVPDIPLLFDETFVALDRENLEEVQRFLSLQKTQIFVITHDQTWQEF